MLNSDWVSPRQLRQPNQLTTAMFTGVSRQSQSEMPFLGDPKLWEVDELTITICDQY